MDIVNHKPLQKHSGAEPINNLPRIFGRILVTMCVCHFHIYIYRLVGIVIYSATANAIYSRTTCT